MNIKKHIQELNAHLGTVPKQTNCPQVNILMVNEIYLIENKKILK